jgi:hypothetical protein
VGSSPKSIGSIVMPSRYWRTSSRVLSSLTTLAASHPRRRAPCSPSEAEAERRDREAQERHHAELAEQNRPDVGIPIPEGLEGVDEFTVLLQHEIEAEAGRKGARQRRRVRWDVAGVTEYHPISDRQEP